MENCESFVIQVFEDRRASNAEERIDNGVESVALLNRPISDFLYQAAFFITFLSTKFMEI